MAAKREYGLGSATASIAAVSSPRRASGLKRRLTPYYLISPSFLVLLGVFGAPVVFLVMVSFFHNEPLAGMSPAFEFDNYLVYVTQPYFWGAVLETVLLAAGATIICALISYPLALILTNRNRSFRLFGALAVVLPLFVSAVVRNLGWIVIFARDGVIDSTFKAIGVHLPMLLYTEGAILVGLVNTLLPYMFLGVFASVRGINPSVPAAAATLGASPWQVFWRVKFPLTLPGLSAGIGIVFGLSASAVVTISMLGGATEPTIPTLMYQQALGLVNYPRAAALAVMMCILILIVLQLVTRLFRGTEKGVVAV